MGWNDPKPLIILLHSERKWFFGFGVVLDDAKFHGFQGIFEVSIEFLTDVRKAIHRSGLVCETNTHRGNSGHSSHTNEDQSSTCRVHGLTWFN